MEEGVCAWGRDRRTWMGSSCDYIPEECQPRIRTDFHMSYCPRDCHPFTYYERIVIYMLWFGDIRTELRFNPTLNVASRSVEAPFNFLHVGELHFFDPQVTPTHRSKQVLLHHTPRCMV